jgi:hypothetical protein
MRHRHLHAALRAFAEEAALQLAADTAEGAEVPFEVVESRPGRRGDPSLYCYRPLTDRFVRERVGVLGRLPAYVPAAQALAGVDGLGDYLRAQGEARVPVEPRERADAALRVFVSRLFAEATEFALTEERFARAWGELEGAVSAGSAETIVLAPLLGVELWSEEVPLGGGLGLVHAEALEEPPPAAAQLGADVLVLLAVGEEPGAPGGVAQARGRFRRLVSALRLYGDAAPALGALAWARRGGGAWAPVLLAGGGRPRGRLEIEPDAEDELRAFCSLVARRTPRAGEVAWALARYEMGCERPGPLHALTDHLLALRALLEPEGPASGRLPGRLAALCAPPGERAALAARVAHAASLERAVVAGLSGAQAGAAELADEICGHLRALLRDVLCGHLEPDLAVLADRLIAQEAPSAA